MQEIINILIGSAVVFLGFPIGEILASLTKEELKEGRAWFKLIIVSGIIGSVASIITSNDVLFFTFLFIIAVTSRSINRKRKSMKNGSSQTKKNG